MTRSIQFTSGDVQFFENGLMTERCAIDAFTRAYFNSAATPPTRGLLPSAVRWVSSAGHSFIIEQQPTMARLRTSEKIYEIFVPWTIWAVTLQRDVGSGQFTVTDLRVFSRPYSMASSFDILAEFPWPIIDGSAKDDYLMRLNNRIAGEPYLDAVLSAIGGLTRTGRAITTWDRDPTTLPEAWRSAAVDGDVINIDKLLSHMAMVDAVDAVNTPFNEAMEVGQLIADLEDTPTSVVATGEITSTIDYFLQIMRNAKETYGG